jgi:hypothetical protein
MPVAEPTLKRIREAPLRPDALAMIFEQIGKMVDQFGAAASIFQLDYQKPDDDLQPGDLLPVITLAVRPYEPAPVSRPTNALEVTADAVPTANAE